MSKESILRLKISNTENATIEVLPSEDGVEIIVRRTEKEKPVKKEEATGNSNYERLRNFYMSKQDDEDIDQGELDRFWKFYCGKMSDWEGKVMPERLYDQWTKKRKK